MTFYNLHTLRAVSIACLLMLGMNAAQAQETSPQVTGFKSLQVNPPCIVVGTSQDKPDNTAAVQTLWVENACDTAVTFDKIDNVFALGAHEADDTQVVFGWRRPEGMRPESKTYHLTFDATGSDCHIEEFLKPENMETQLRAKCKSLTFAAGYSIGFRPYAPVRIDWRGADGAMISGEMLQQ